MTETGHSQGSDESEEIWSLFAQEGRDYLSAAEMPLLRLERDFTDTEQVKALFRALHSFKGAARMMGLSVMESVAHHAEDLIALARDEGVPLQAEMIDMILAVIDRLRVMLDHVLTYRVDADPAQTEDLISSLQQMIARSKEANCAEPCPHEPIITTDSEPVATPAPCELPVTQAAEIQAAPAAPAASSDACEFLQAAEKSLSQFHCALEALASGSSDALEQIRTVSSHLKEMAEQTGCLRVAGVLDELEAEVRSDSRTDLDERFARIKKLELTLFEELARVQDTAAPQETREATGCSDIAWLFRHWHAERVFADLSRLGEIADQLDQLGSQFTSGINGWGEKEKLAEEATVHLRAIYHSCIFYHFDSAIHLTLSLADLYARAVNGELVITEVLTHLTRSYVTNLGAAIDAILKGEEPELEELTTLIEQVQNFSYLNADGPAFQVTRDILEVLNLPADFKQAMTPETIAQFSGALQAGERFYTILVDLERNQPFGEAFFEWSRSDDIRLITNITVFRFGRTLFNFLLATPYDRETLLGSLVPLDPEWEYLSLEECAFRQEDLQSQPAEAAGRKVQLTPAPGSAGVSADALENLIETVGALVADHATLCGVVNRLGRVEPAEEILRVLGAAKGDAVLTRRGLQTLLGEWTDGVHTLSQVQNQMAAALGSLQESAGSLRQSPVSEMLNPLQRMVQELAHRQGKLVELDLQGTDLRLDRKTVQVLTEPLRRLVWFAVTHGVEDVERRRTAGKPTAGRVSVQVSAREDHAQVVIEDDGQGIDQEMVMKRVRELGWSDDDTTGSYDFILRPGFGAIGSDGGDAGVDLAALRTELREVHGRLSVSSATGKGTRLEMRIPYDLAVVDGMVVRVGEVRYVVPVNAIRRIVLAEPTNLVHSSAGHNQSMYRFEGGLVRIRTLGGNQDGGSEQPKRAFDGNLLMIVDGENGRAGFPIDELLGRQQVLVRPLQGQLAYAQNASGCALLGEGEIGIVLSGI